MATLLLIADGFGFSTGFAGNAITLARPSQFHYLWQRSVHAVLKTAGLVALNRPIDAESAHFVIGTGTRPTFEVKDTLAEQPAAISALLADVAAGSRRLHVMLPLSIETVSHMIPDLQTLSQATRGDNQLIVHVVLGSESGAQASSRLINNFLRQFPGLVLGSLVGSSYTTDEQLCVTYLRALHRGRVNSQDPVVTLDEWYRRDGVDSDFPPTIMNAAAHFVDRDTLLLLAPGGAPFLPIMTQIASGKLPGFLFAQSLPAISLWTVRRIAPLKGRVKALLYPAAASQSFPHLLAQAGKKVLKLATREKIDLLTFALNGGTDETLAGETVREIGLKSYSIEAEAERLRTEINAGLSGNEFDLIIAHFSALDRMVHAQDIAEASKAVTALDNLLRHLTESVTRLRSDLIFLSAHGGAEQMLKAVSATSAIMLHSQNPVPLFIYRASQPRNPVTESLALEIIEGKQTLLDVAPTLLELFNVNSSVPLEGHSILGSHTPGTVGIKSLLAGLNKS